MCSGAANATAESLGYANFFDLQKHIVQAMQGCYEDEDYNTLENIPKLSEDRANNTVTFKFLPMTNQPFTNETPRDRIGSVKGWFMGVVENSGPTEFYSYLCSLIDEFERKTDELRDEIIGTPEYKSAKSQARRRDPNPRLVYRQQEMKKKDEVITLCREAEMIYELSSRLYEGVRSAAGR